MGGLAASCLGLTRGGEVVGQAGVVFVTGRGGAGFHRQAPPLLRGGVYILSLQPAPHGAGPRLGHGEGRGFDFPRLLPGRVPVL